MFFCVLAGQKSGRLKVADIGTSSLLNIASHHHHLQQVEVM